MSNKLGSEQTNILIHHSKLFPFTHLYPQFQA